MKVFIREGREMIKKAAARRSLIHCSAGEYSHDVMPLNEVIMLQRNESFHHPDQCAVHAPLLHHAVASLWTVFKFPVGKFPLGDAIITAYVITNPPCAAHLLNIHVPSWLIISQ